VKATQKQPKKDLHRGIEDFWHAVLLVSKNDTMFHSESNLESFANFTMMMHCTFDLN
jgi:hypothetical protein